MMILSSLILLVCLAGFAMVILRVNRVEAKIDRMREAMPPAP